MYIVKSTKLHHPPPGYHKYVISFLKQACLCVQTHYIMETLDVQVSNKNEASSSRAQKREDEERQKGEEEVRCAEEKRVKELYMMLQQEQKKQSEHADQEWEEQREYLLENTPPSPSFVCSSFV